MLIFEEFIDKICFLFLMSDCGRSVLAAGTTTLARSARVAIENGVNKVSTFKLLKY